MKSQISCFFQSAWDHTHLLVWFVLLCLWFSLLCTVVCLLVFFLFQPWCSRFTYYYNFQVPSFSLILVNILCAAIFLINHERMYQVWFEKKSRKKNQKRYAPKKLGIMSISWNVQYPLLMSINLRMLYPIIKDL